MASSGHRANILGNYNRVGVGVVVQGDHIWVTFDFLKGPPISGSTGIDAAVPVPNPPGPPVVPLASRTRYNPVSPFRVLDTRLGLGGYAGVLNAGATPAHADGRRGRRARRRRRRGFEPHGGRAGGPRAT